jgi:hypothetical protein
MSSSLEIGEHVGPFGEEFSHLDAAVRRTNVIRGRRTAALLNWRYRADPLQQFEVMTAKRAGDLTAFVVLQNSGEIVTIVDLFGVALDESALVLLDSVANRYERSHQTLDAYLAEGSELIGHFFKLGFRLRSEAAHVVAYAKPQTELSAFLQSKPIWAFNKAEIRV